MNAFSRSGWKKYAGLFAVLVVSVSLFSRNATSESKAPAADNCGSTLTVKNGHEFTVRLEALASAGYIWTAETYNSALLDHSGNSEILGNKDGLDGGVSLQVLHFRAKAPGIDTIHFSYKRPWKKDQAPVKTCIINVTITE